jgi:hypothetical protein
MFVKLFGDFSRYLDLERRRIEAPDAAHSTHSVSGGFPEALPSNSVGAYRSHSCDHRATHRFYFAFGILAGIG